MALSSSQYPRQPTDGIDALLLKIQTIKREISDLPNGLLRAAGIEITPDGMRIDSSLALTGTLSLPAGIIDNDALANPVTFASTVQSVDGVGVPSIEDYYSPATLDVPDGFASGVFYGIASCSVYNPTGSSQYVFVRARVDSSNGWWQQSGRQERLLPAGEWASLVAVVIAAGSLEPGGSVMVRTGLLATAALAVEPGSWATTEVSGIFTR